MARKDRERARKRHAIQRARREAGDEPAPKVERPATKTQTRRPAGGRPGQGQPMKNAHVGDVHPKVALYIYFGVLGIGLVSLLRRDPTLQAVGYGAFALGMLVIADSKTTWMRALPFIVLAAALAAGAVALAIGLG